MEWILIEWIPLVSLVLAIVIIAPIAIWLDGRKKPKRSLIVPDERKWWKL